MLFNSLTFIIFFAVVLGLYYLPLPWRVRKFNLLWASYLFYAAWNPPFVTLLWISTVVDWHCAKWIFRARGVAARRALLLISLAANLGLLGFFKYGGFLLTNFITAAQFIGIDFHPASPDIILPVGISFYTFQTLFYTLDVYRGAARPCSFFLDYALYVTFFPQLVAGPIVRSTDFLPQCLEPKRAASSQIGWGLTLMVLGLFEKMVIADGLLATPVALVYDAQGAPGFASAWAGTLAFAGEIFCDFAGYSTCAIGAAMCLGFWLPENFRFPYAAAGFSDFWRRWHISLSSWLKDYLYIPLGGNRKGSIRTFANLAVTMLLGGLWHGASWLFVIWGGMHGALLGIERLLRKVFPLDKPDRAWPVQMAVVAGTFIAICFTWVFFRAHSLGRATAIAAGMLGRPGEDLLSHNKVLIVAVVVAAMLALHWRLRGDRFEHAAARLPWWVRSAAIAGMLVAILLMRGEDRAFIYFQF